jgi:hypothetical protein
VQLSRARDLNHALVDIFAQTVEASARENNISGRTYRNRPNLRETSANRDRSLRGWLQRSSAREGRNDRLGEKGSDEKSPGENQKVH